MKKGIDLPSLWWTDIDGYEGLYKVSIDGDVKSLITGKILRPRKTKDGYLRVDLCKDGKRKSFLVHRLVAQAFIPNDDPEHKTQVNHISEFEKTNNRVENLSWTTPKENTNWGTGIQRSAEKKRNGKLSKPVVALDKQGRIVHVFPSTHEADRNGYDWRAVSACCLGKLKHHKNLIWRYQNDFLKKIC